MSYFIFKDFKLTHFYSGQYLHFVIKINFCSIKFFRFFSVYARPDVPRVFSDHRLLPGRLRQRPERQAAGLGGRRPHPVHRREETARGHAALPEVHDAG